MKSIKNKFLAVLIITTLSAMVLYSCKKTNDNLSDAAVASQEGLLSAKMKIGEYIKANGLQQRVEVNQRLVPVWSDLQGNPIDIAAYRASHANFVSTCGGDDPDYVDNNYYSINYICGSGYQIAWGYTISWDNKVVNTNPTNSLNVTKGQCKISVTGNANAFVNTTALAVITDLGADPNNANNNIYKVDFTSSAYCPASVANNITAVLRINAHFASDCADLSEVSLTYAVPTAGVMPSDAFFPCAHNDRIFYNAPGIATPNNKISAFGYDPLSTCSNTTDYTEAQRPSLQEVQYNVDGGTWTATTNKSCPTTFGYYNHSFVGQLDYAESAVLPSGSHTIRLRCRNWKYSSAQTNYPVPTTSIACSTGFWTESGPYSVTIP